MVGACGSTTKHKYEHATHLPGQLQWDECGDELLVEEVLLAPGVVFRVHYVRVLSDKEIRVGIIQLALKYPLLQHPVQRRRCLWVRVSARANGVVPEVSRLHSCARHDGWVRRAGNRRRKNTNVLARKYEK